MEYKPHLSEDMPSKNYKLGADKTANAHQLSFTDQEKDNGSPKEDEEVYTVEEAVNLLGFGLFQIVATLFAGMTWVSWAGQGKKEKREVFSVHS